MKPQAKLSSIGPVMQMSYVPKDLDAAIKHWTENMGVGPFFLIENVQLANMRFLGAPSDAAFTVALSYWGDMQIELIRPENGAPFIFGGAYLPPEGAVHHVAIMADDMDKALEIAKASGATLLVEGDVGPQSKAVYLDSGTGAGGMIEITCFAEEHLAFFEMVHQTCANWDGRDPIRSIGNAGVGTARDDI
jgi:methylmalonyl-CoA/ethylmalonyl-CoA epimerase